MMMLRALLLMITMMMMMRKGVSAASVCCRVARTFSNDFCVKILLFVRRNSLKNNKFSPPPSTLERVSKKTKRIAP